MDPSRRRPQAQPAAQAAGSRRQAPAAQSRQGQTVVTPDPKWPTNLTFQLKDLVMLTEDIHSPEFKKGQIVTLLKVKTTETTPQNGDSYGGQQEVVATDTNTLYKLSKLEPRPVDAWYTSGLAGQFGAPHHLDVSLVPGGPYPTQKLDVGTKLYIKNPVTVFVNPETRQGGSLVAPANTRCIVAHVATHLDSRPEFSRPGSKSAVLKRYFYVIQVKVIAHEWKEVVCLERARFAQLKKLSPTETRRYKERVLPPLRVVSVTDQDEAR